MKYEEKFRIDDRSQRDISSMAARASLSGSCLTFVMIFSSWSSSVQNPESSSLVWMRPLTAAVISPMAPPPSPGRLVRSCTER